MSTSDHTRTYNVKCPVCAVNNTLQWDDLGKNLNCGSCGAGFMYDEPLKRERYQREREEKKRKAEAKAKRAVERERHRVEKAQRAMEERARQDRAAAAERRARQEAEQYAQQQAQQRLQYSGGCQRCGSTKIRQTKYTTAGGWALFVIGILSACFTFGGGLILCFGALFMTGRKSMCENCYYEWRTV